MTCVTVAMLGARRHYAVPRLLHEAGLLDRFYTDSYVSNKRWLEATLRTTPAALRCKAIDRWLGRSDAVLPPEKVISFEQFGLWYALAQQRAHRKSDLSSVYSEGARRFAKRILDRGLDCQVLWGFNGAALELFEGAKRQGVQCILDQSATRIA